MKLGGGSELSDLQELQEHGLTLDAAKDLIEALGYDFDELWTTHKQNTETPLLTKEGFVLEIIEAAIFQMEEIEDINDIIFLGLNALGLLY